MAPSSSKARGWAACRSSTTSSGASTSTGAWGASCPRTTGACGSPQARWRLSSCATSWCTTALYAIGEWAARLQPALLGLGEGDAAFLNDDRVGRALDRLFDCDRASLLTETVLEAVRVFAIDCSELHNDSTTVTVTGQRLREGRTPGPWRQESTHRHLRPQQGFPPDTATARLRAHGLLRRRGAGRGEDL